ncbi:unnamed protein product [Prunus armeniaca]
MGAPAGLRDSIFPCVLIPLGFLNACTWNLFSQQPLTCESLAFFVDFCFSQVLKALDSFYSNGGGRIWFVVLDRGPFEVLK